MQRSKTIKVITWPILWQRNRPTLPPMGPKHAVICNSHKVLASTHSIRRSRLITKDAWTHPSKNQKTKGCFWCHLQARLQTPAPNHESPHSRRDPPNQPRNAAPPVHPKSPHIPPQQRHHHFPPKPSESPLFTFSRIPSVAASVLAWVWIQARTGLFCSRLAEIWTF